MKTSEINIFLNDYYGRVLTNKLSSLNYYVGDIVGVCWPSGNIYLWLHSDGTARYSLASAVWDVLEKNTDRIDCWQIVGESSLQNIKNIYSKHIQCLLDIRSIHLDLINDDWLELAKLWTPICHKIYNETFKGVGT